MLSTWIEASAKGRHGGSVRAGMWSTVVIGTHPIETDQEVWLEAQADDRLLGPLPAFWLENKGVNSLWHVPIAPQAVGTRLRYRAGARRGADPPAFSPFQEVVVRPNLPRKQPQATAGVSFPEGLVGNRRSTVKVDARGSTFDIFFPTAGMHTDVRPAEGEEAQSRAHFRAIVGGLAIERRLDWFDERLAWQASQQYRGTTNILTTDLSWRHGPVRVLATDFVASGPNLPRTAGGTVAAGQYFKRFHIKNESERSRRALFGLYVHAEVNGGVGEAGLNWHDEAQALLAFNRGHSHVNRKLGRDSTIEFAIAMDDRGEVMCEPAGLNEAMLLRWIDLPAGQTHTLDVLVSGAFTGWRGDPGTFEHWLRPALAWFRGIDVDQIEQETAAYWNTFVEPLPTLRFANPNYNVVFRRSALAASLHTDDEFGAVASGYDRGISAYCWPRDAVGTAGALDRVGHDSIGRGVFEWLATVRSRNRQYVYWFQKYTIDGWPEWETPAVDQTAIIPWALERHFRRTGDLSFLKEQWPLVEQAAAVCGGASGHPGLKWLDDLALVSSAGIWDNRFAAFLYSNVCIVAGLRAAARLATRLGHLESEAQWTALADRIWDVGILKEAGPGDDGPGLYDASIGRFLEARRLSTLRGLWTDSPDLVLERSPALDVSLLSLAMPFRLLPASDARLMRTASAILKRNALPGDPSALLLWSAGTEEFQSSAAPGNTHQNDASSAATLWMARYLLQLGKETGDGRQWSRALRLLDDIIARLGPLGLALNRGAHMKNGHDGPFSTPGVNDLHTPILETLLDMAGLDFDAADETLILDPVLVPEWSQSGIEQVFLCGRVAYTWQHSAGSRPSNRLALNAVLDIPVKLQVSITCPGLDDLGAWIAPPRAPTPRFDKAKRRLNWTMNLPAGSSQWDWAWGQ
jgi:hypothetical protein